MQLNIGHGVKDVHQDPTERGWLGGATPYGVVADVRSQPPGMEKPVVVTKMGWDEAVFHDFVSLGQQEQFPVINIASQSLRNGITTYANIYDEFNRRTQHRFGFNPTLAFNEHDLDTILQITKGESADLFIGTVSGHGEMTPGFMRGLREIAKNGIISATIQGWHRYTDEKYRVYHQPIPDEELEGLLSTIQVGVFSDEDISFGLKDTHGFPIPDEGYLMKIAEHVPLVLLTQGEKGVRVIQEGRDTGVVEAFPLTPLELSVRNPTGLGDTCWEIAAREISRGEEINTAVAFAELVAAAKLAEGPGTIQGRREGMGSLLTLDQIRQFTMDRAVRVLEYAEGLQRSHPQVHLQELLHDTYGIDLESAIKGKEGASNPLSRR